MRIDMVETIKAYSIHGERVMVTGPDPELLEPVFKFLRYFEDSVDRDSADLHIQFSPVSSRGAVPHFLPAHDYRIESHNAQAFGEDLIGAWQCDVYACDGILTVDLRQNGMLCVNYREGTGQGFLVNPRSFHSDILVSYFHFILSELLKRQGLYTIHATSLERGGHGVLIPGFSGRGKTTACISLLRSGYRCISDDHPLLRMTTKGLEVLSFPEKVDVTENSMKFFPEFKGNLAQEKLYHGLIKRYFYVEDFYPGGTARSCKPSLLLFPQVVDHPTSHVEPILKRLAFEEVLPHGLLVYEKTIAKKEFQALSNLIQTVKAYRLYFGKDVLDLHRLIDPLLS